MGKQHNAAKRPSHGAVPVSPQLAKTPLQDRKIPQAIAVNFANSVNVAPNVYANQFQNFVTTSVAIQGAQMFVPGEGVERNPTSHGLQTVHANVGQIIEPKKLPVPAAVVTQVGESKVDECYTRLKAAIKRMGEQAKGYLKEHPASATWEFGSGVPQGAWESAKDTLGGIGSLLKMGATAAWNDPLGALRRVTPGLALYDDVTGLARILNEAKALDINLEELGEEALEQVKEVAAEALCGLADKYQAVGNDPAKATGELGKLTGEMVLQAAVGAATGGAGTAAKGAGMAGKVAGKVGAKLDKLPNLEDEMRKLLQAAKKRKDAKKANPPPRPDDKSPPPKPAEPPQAPPPKDGQVQGKGQGEAPPSQCCPSAGDDTQKKGDGKQDSGKGSGKGSGGRGGRRKPVNPILGTKFLAGEEELDFHLPAPLPLIWQRFYVSSDARVGLLGQGWSLPTTLQLKPFADRTVFIDGTAREMDFPALPPGGRFRSPYEQLTLQRYGAPADAPPLTDSQLELLARHQPALAETLRQQRDAADPEAAAKEAAKLGAAELSARTEARFGFPLDENTWTMAQDDGLTFVFRPPTGPTHPWRKNAWPMVAVVDPNGYALHFLYDENGLVHTIVDSAGRVYRFGLIRVTPIHDGDPGLRLGGIWLDEPATVRSGDDLAKLRQAPAPLVPDWPPLGADRLQLEASPWLVRYLYSAAGDLEAVINGNGEVTRRFGWQNHLLVMHQEGDGAHALVCHYEYDQPTPAGRVIRHTANDGADYRFDYFPDHTVFTDTLGRKTTYHFTGTPRQPGQRWTGLTYPDGSRETYEYAPHGQLTAVVDTVGRRTEYTLDGNGYVIGITDPMGRSTQLRRDGQGRVTALTNPLGHTWQYRYDPRGRLLAESDPLERITTYVYQSPYFPDRPTQIRDAKGGVKQLDWSGDGQLAAYTDCSGHTTRFDYDFHGNLRRETNAEEQVTQYFYDRQGRLIRVQQPDGADQHYRHDALGRLIAHTDSLGAQTRYQLHPRGYPQRRIDALGHTLDYEYDRAGRLVRLTNENGAHWRFYYDDYDRLAAETGFDGAYTEYRYDSEGELTEKHEYGSGPNALPPDYPPPTTGDLSDPAAWAAHVQANLADPHFNVLGAAASQVGRPGQHFLRTVYERDAEGRLTRQITADGVTDYGYDEIGRLIQVSNGSARITFVYDAVGQLISETTTSAGGSQTLRHQYDLLGNRIATTLPDGRTLNTLVYGSGHVHQINLDGEVIADFEHNRLYQEIRRTQGPLATRRRHDALGRLITQEIGPDTDGLPGPILHERHYQYDRNGQLQSLLDQQRGSTHYVYDDIGRLLQARHRDHTETFAFDPAHNRIPPAKAEAPKPGQAGSKVPLGLRLINNRLTEWENERYTHDRHGNRIETKRGDGSVQTLTWNARHQLVGAKEEKDGRIISEASYRYDPLGRRVGKTVTRYTAQGKPETATTHYLWDGNRLLLEETDTTQRLYLYEPDSFVPLARVDSDLLPVEPANTGYGSDVDDDTELDPQAMKAAMNRRPQDILKDLQQTGAAKLQLNPLAYVTHSGQLPIVTNLPTPPRKSTNTRTYWYHCDHLGTPQELTDQQGNTVWAATYEAWGKTRKLQRFETRIVGNTLQQVAVDVAPVEQNLRFQGQYYDLETGLHYNRFRYYDPGVGRFVSKDPIGLFGGKNLYIYTRNPTGWIDPFGLAERRPKDCKRGAEIYAEQKREIEKAIALHDYKDSGHTNANPQIPGGVSGAIIYTKETGNLVEKSTHVQKGQDINNILRNALKAIKNAYDLTDCQKSELIALGQPYYDRLQAALNMRQKVPIKRDIN